MNEIKIWYRNLNFRKKIILLCLMLSMIPTVILGTFSMVKCRELLYRQEEVFVNNTLEQTNQSLEYFLFLYSNAMNSLVWDKSIQNAVNKEYTSNYERFLAKSEVFDVRLPMVSNINADVLQVTTYTDTNMYPYGNRIAALEDIQMRVGISRPLPLIAHFL